MLREHFLAFSAMFPEPMLLVRADGLILAASPAAVKALSDGPPLEGRTLAALSTDPPARIADYLRLCGRSRQMLPGALVLRHAHAAVRYRVQGALLCSPSEEHEGAVLLRLASPTEGPSRFALLTEKIDALTKEVARRTAAEAAFRGSERERERVLVREHDARLAAERALAEAKAANRTKDEFLSILSHELRTPLTAILGWSNVLRGRAPAPAVAARALAAIERNARAQARLIEDILDVSRIVTGKVRLSMAIVDVSAVARAALESVRPTAEDKGVAIEARLGDAATRLHGDGDRLQQILSNLLSNAVKFTPAGGRIEVTLTREDAWAALHVTDTGEGIGADFLPHLFERFRQADASYTRAHDGLGLGLAIARHLTELHGGTLTATSEGPGRGATFVVTLPALPPDATLDRVPPEKAASQAPRGSPLRSVRVLVTDDQQDARELIETILQDRGADVVTASSAAEALALMERTDFDVLVSDIGMPEQDGHALLYRARHPLSERSRHVPALALTAYASAEDATTAYAAGFEMYLTKPIVPEVLIAAVARLAGR